MVIGPRDKLLYSGAFNSTATVSKTKQNGKDCSQLVGFSVSTVRTVSAASVRRSDKCKAEKATIM